MFQILTFDDDTLPKIRRAVMLTATLLVLICVGHLRLDLTKGPLTVRLPEGFAANAFDPAVILAPVLIYMLLRMGVTAWWYFKLAKIETVKEDGDFSALAAALRAYQAEAAARTAYVMPMAQAHIDSVADISERLKQLSSSHAEAELNSLIIRAKKTVRAISNPFEYSGDYTDERSKAKGALAQATSERTQRVEAALDAMLSDFSELDQMATSYKDTIADALDIAATFGKQVNEHANVRHVTEIANALDVLSTDLIVGAKRKYLIERSFGFALPLLWGLFALWLARAPLLDLGQFLRALLG